MISTEEFIKLVVTSIIVIIGWITVHYFTSKRDAKNKKREISLNHLISSYDVLTNEISQRLPSKERNDKMERLISQIQLFGTVEQVKLALSLKNEIIVTNGNGDLDPLIKSLRNSLRKELKLDQISENVEWIRY